MMHDLFTKSKRSGTATAMLGALAIALAGASFANDSRAQAGAEKPALTVTTVVPLQTNVASSFAASGNVVAWQEAIIGAEINGVRIREVKANVGDRVAMGQVLATFATEMIDAELAQSRANLVEAEAAFAEAKANADRAASLDTSGALSSQQLQQFSTAAKTAEARLAAARALNRLQQVRLSQTQLVAPDEGTISARMATVGAVVQSGQELFRMLRRDRLEWRAEVTAAELSKVTVGQKVTLTTPSGEKVGGSVRMIAPIADPITRNVQVFVDLAANKSARPGTFARGEFALGKSSALTLPSTAVVARDGFMYAFAVDAKNRVTQLKLEIGVRIGDQIEIRRGLPANTNVVATGAGFLKDGDLVRVVANRPPPPASSAPK